MKDNFELFLKHTLKLEGGYVNDPDDAGGETNFGITRKVYAEYLKRELGIELQDDVSMKNIPEEHVSAIYKKYYWDAIKSDDLPDGIDFIVADMAVNSGNSRASKMLQKIVGVEQDGFIGPFTIEKTNTFDPKFLLHKIFMARREYYKAVSGIRNNEKFLLGWYNRLNDVYNKCHRIIYK